MTKITEYSPLAEADAALQSTRASSAGKGQAKGKAQSAFSDVLDTVSISESAKNKNAAAAANEQTGELAAGKNGDKQFKNETHALKAAIQGLADEAGVPVGGWGLGHYRKAFRAAEDGDLSAVRGIFQERYGLKDAPIVEDPVVDPTDTDPTTGEEPAVEDETPLAENPVLDPSEDDSADGGPAVDVEDPADPADALADIIDSGKEEEDPTSKADEAPVAA